MAGVIQFWEFEANTSAVEQFKLLRQKNKVDLLQHSSTTFRYYSCHRCKQSESRLQSDMEIQERLPHITLQNTVVM